MNASNRLQRCNVRQVRGGHARLACRWVAVVGALVLSLTALGAPQAVTLEVTNINDAGAGSLRQALIDAPVRRHHHVRFRSRPDHPDQWELGDYQEPDHQRSGGRHPGHQWQPGQPRLCRARGRDGDDSGGHHPRWRLLQ